MTTTATPIDMSTGTTTPLPEGLSVGNYTIDPAHSDASFTVRHAMISTVRGHFAIQSGHLTITDDLHQSHSEAVLDVASVETAIRVAMTTCAQ